jgi:hypothetical protein
MKVYGGMDVYIHFFLTSALVEGKLSDSRPCHSPPGEKSLRYPLERRLGKPQSRSGERGEEKNTRPYRDSNSVPSVVQPVASRYTDYPIPAP